MSSFWYCSQCNLAFDTLFEQGQHMQSSYGHQMTWLCGFCDLSFTNGPAFKHHMASLHIACDACGEQFSSPAALQQHDHPLLGRVSTVGPFWRWASSRKRAQAVDFFVAGDGSRIDSLERTDLRHHTCRNCFNRGFETKEKLAEHIEGSSAHRSSECPDCGRVFVNPRVRAQHQRYTLNHSSMRYCEECNVFLGDFELYQAHFATAEAHAALRQRWAYLH